MAKKKPVEKQKTLTPDELEEQQMLEENTDLLTEQQNNDFPERYESVKSREIEKLSKEIEERNSTDTKKKRRTWWIKTTLLLVLIGASIGLMFGITQYLDDGSISFVAMLKGIKWEWFAALIGTVLVMIFFESMKYAYLLKVSTGKWRVRNATKTMFLGKYYDGITPLGTGGQPFQIYYLHKKDIPAGVATAVPLVRYIVSTIVFCMLSVALLITSHFVVKWDSIGGTVVMVIAWISLAVNLVVPIAIVFISIFPKGGKKFIIRFVAFLHKIRIVKRKYKVTRKYVYEMSEYSNSIKVLVKHWGKLIPLALISIVEVIAYVLVPFCTVMAIADLAFSWNTLLTIACLSIISFYTSSLVPTPGNSGANEAVSTIVFASVADLIAGSGVIGWVVLTWRFFNYYVYILSGIGINIFEVIRGAVRQRRAEKAEKLALQTAIAEEAEQTETLPVEPSPAETPPNETNE